MDGGAVEVVVVDVEVGGGMELVRRVLGGKEVLVDVDVDVDVDVNIQVLVEDEERVEVVELVEGSVHVLLLLVLVEWPVQVLLVECSVVLLVVSGQL